MLSTFLYSPINYSLLLGMPFIDSRLTTIPNCNASEQLIREIFLPTPFRSAFLNTERKTSLNTANQRIDNPFLFTSHRLGECFQIRSRVPVDWPKSLQHLYACHTSVLFLIFRILHGKLQNGRILIHPVPPLSVRVSPMTIGKS